MVAVSLAVKVTDVPDGPNVPPIGYAETVGAVVSIVYCSVTIVPELPVVSLPKNIRVVLVEIGIGAE